MPTNAERDCSFRTVIANGVQETSERGLMAVKLAFTQHPIYRLYACLYW
jgi:hypothetical protein